MSQRLIKTYLSSKPTSPSVLTGLLAYLVLLLVFLFGNPTWSASGYELYEKGNYWKAFSSTLMHADFVHFGHNSLFFVLFSVLLNHYFGFWIFPLLSFVAGGLINLVTLKIYDPHVHLVGISGVIYFMAAFWMVMFVGIDRRRTLIRRLIIATAISLILFFPDTWEKNVSYLAHGLGFALGLILGIPYFFLKKNSFRKFEVWKDKSPDNEELLEYIKDWEEAQGSSLKKETTTISSPF